MLNKYVDIIKSLKNEEDRTEDKINSCISELKELKTSDKVMNEFTDYFISLCKYLKGDKSEILNLINNYKASN